MAQTAINKPIYDAFVDAGASDEKATLAARAVLPSVDEAATKTDITLLSSAIERLESSTKADSERLEAAMKAAIKQSEAATKAAIEQSEAATKAATKAASEQSEAATKEASRRSEVNAKTNNIDLKADLLRWIAVMLGVVIAAIGLIANLLVGALPLGGV